MLNSIYYQKGQRAKQLVGVYKNPYLTGTYEHDQWKAGFDSVPYEPINYEIELEDCSDVLETIMAESINPKIINK